MHEGHRKRMYEKLENGADLFDHEALEMLLYSVCPRINTNPLAHELLNRFGSLSEIFNADIDELKEVDGVGDNVARFLKVVGVCALRAGKAISAPSLKNFEDCRKFIVARLSNKTEEFIELYFLDKSSRVRRTFRYTTSEKGRAAVSAEVIARNVALFHPYGVIIAHNHVNGSPEPSCYDDDFTRTLTFICDMNGARLFDHFIYLSRDEIYSYKDAGRLDEVKNRCNWETFEKWIKTLN